MCNKATCLMAGLVLGVMIGYQNESEIDDIARQTRRAKRKMMRKMCDMKEHFEM